MIPRKTLIKLARIGTVAIVVSAGYCRFGPYEGTGAPNLAMERIAKALRTADLYDRRGQCLSGTRRRPVSGPFGSRRINTPDPR